jgi:hypothetical protein
MSTLYVDNLQPNLGSGVIIAGHTLQTVHGVTSTQVDISALNTWTNIYTNVATITPKSASSKILITGVISFYYASLTTNYGQFRADLAINRNSTLLGEVMGYAGWMDTGSTIAPMINIPFTYLDSPASTSTLNYGFSARVSNYGSAANVSFTYDDGGGDQQSSFVLQEIAQ